MKPKSVFPQWIFVVVILPIAFGFQASSFGEDNKKDPTTPTDVIQKTMSKIKEVEKLDAYVAKNKELAATNKKLQQQIASINKQVQKLTKELAEQQTKLRKQLLQMPTFELKAKFLGNGRDMAILKYKDRYLRIRTDTKMSVPVADGVYVLMHVKKISKDMIELHFPELERELYLYD